MPPQTGALPTDLTALFTLLYVSYAVGVIVFLIMDRRSAQSTFAWLLLLLSVPVLGLVVYVMTGRSWKAFSRQNEYVRKDIGAQLRSQLVHFTPEHAMAQMALRDLDVPLYARLARLGTRNSLAVVTTNNRITLLQDAIEKYPLLYLDMEAARETIHLEYFSWATDATMERFNELLLRKVRDGVKVRLLYDAAGSFSLLKRRDSKLLTAGGVEIIPFSPILRLHTVSYRNHRKIAVIDGRVGYVGGMNMGEEHLKGSGDHAAWRDTHLRLEGAAVRALQAAFVQDWYHATRRSLLDPALFPPLDVGPAGADPQGAQLSRAEELLTGVGVMAVLAAAQRSGDEDAHAPAAPVAPAAARQGPFSSTGTVQLISSGPDSRHEAVRQMYFYMITAATHHVYIQSPFFILDASLAEALKAAAMAGVDVKIMLAPQGGGDNPVPYWAAYTYMLDMMSAGAKVYLYQPGYMHAKTVSVDGLVCSVGSANMDIRSFNIDYEINAIVYDAAIARRLEADFEEDLKGCVLFNPRLYRKLPFSLRFRNASARLLSPLL